MKEYDFDNFNRFSQNPLWLKYDSLINEMGNDQKVFVGKQQDVLEAKQLLMSTFIDYLFNQHRDTFIMSSDEARKLADRYIDCVHAAAGRYVTRSEELEKENVELKKQLKQLLFEFEEKKTNAKNQNSTK